MYPNNLNNKASIAFAASDVAERALWVKTVSPEELALFCPRNS